LILANAQHLRNVPGRKSDVNDAMWIADLLAHGLIRSSFVPPAPIQQMRDLTRTRKQLVREVAQHSARIQKVLEDANLKIASVLSDVLGQTGRAILAAVIEGETDPGRLADLARGTARLTTLVTAAWAAARSKDTYLRAQFLRLKSERGPKKAILAVAASILTAAYHMLRDAAEYSDLGPHHFERDRAKAISRLVKRLKDLGCEVEIKAAA
jgi:transposase